MEKCIFVRYEECLSIRVAAEFLTVSSNPVLFQQFGGFPLIDKSWSDGTILDLTDLLTYFNKNRTVMTGFLPHISRDTLNSSQARISVSSLPKKFLNKKIKIPDLMVCTTSYAWTFADRIFAKIRFSWCIGPNRSRKQHV